jgi:hypothetical protein
MCKCSPLPSSSPLLQVSVCYHFSLTWRTSLSWGAVLRGPVLSACVFKPLFISPSIWRIFSLIIEQWVFRDFFPLPAFQEPLKFQSMVLMRCYP